MELNTNEININRYINNELSGEELNAFEAELQQDIALQKKINFHKEVDAVLYDKMAPVKEFKEEEALLLPTLNELGEQYFLKDKKEEETRTIEPTSEAKPKSGIVKRLIPFATLVAVAAVLLFVIAPWKSNLTNPQLATKHFEAFDLEYIMSEKDDLTIYDQAKKAYHSKNYLEALPLLNQYLKTNPNSPKALLAKGSTEFKLNQLDEAIKSFKLTAGHSSYKAIAHWYLALTYLKKDDKVAAKESLQQIKKGEENHEEAQKLLKKID